MARDGDGRTRRDGRSAKPIVLVERPLPEADRLRIERIMAWEDAAGSGEILIRGPRVAPVRAS